MMRKLFIAVILIGFAGIVFTLLNQYYDPLNNEINKWLPESIAIALTAFVFVVYIIRQKYVQKNKWEVISEENQLTSHKLHEQQNQFETIFLHTNNGIAMVGLDGKFIRTNRAFNELIGYPENDLLTLNLYYLIHPSDLTQLQMNIQQLIDKKIEVFESEQQCFKKNGEAAWMMSTYTLIRDFEDKPHHFLIQAQDITLQKKAEERLRHMAYHDPLTGLANRNKLEQFIVHILASARRHQQGFALLFLDLDHFKNVNDTIGHEAGDLLLQIVAERLRSAVRSTDMVARLGGDEFVLLITDVMRTEAVAAVAQKILENVLRVIIIKGQEIYITTSIGISFYPYDGANMQALMKNADLALYRAKEHGRNNYQFYTVEMTSKAQEKLSLQTAIGHALVKDEFYLHYQPKMDIKTRRITGIEAFLRWKNQDYSGITPDEIIALAEETGLIIQVSDWIMRTALKQLKAWHDLGMTTLTMAINCSPRQFKQAKFVDDIMAVLGQFSLSPNMLEIEVTESVIMKDTENLVRTLYALKDLGVQIAIDDFGTGYWSLSNLRRLSVDKIKIDKSFIKQITIEETSAAITLAVIAMVNKLGIKSVAEGVETRAQYDFLAQENCTEIQGYYITQPLAADEMTEFLKHPIPDAEAINRTKS